MPKIISFSLLTPPPTPFLCLPSILLSFLYFIHLTLFSLSVPLLLPFSVCVSAGMGKANSQVLLPPVPFFWPLLSGLALRTRDLCFTLGVPYNVYCSLLLCSTFWVSLSLRICSGRDCFDRKSKRTQEINVFLKTHYSIFVEFAVFCSVCLEWIFLLKWNI